MFIEVLCQHFSAYENGTCVITLVVFPQQICLGHACYCNKPHTGKICCQNRLGLRLLVVLLLYRFSVLYTIIQRRCKGVTYRSCPHRDQAGVRQGLGQSQTGIMQGSSWGQEGVLYRCHVQVVPRGFSLRSGHVGFQRGYAGES